MLKVKLEIQIIPLEYVSVNSLTSCTAVEAPNNNHSHILPPLSLLKTLEKLLAEP